MEPLHVAICASNQFNFNTNSTLSDKKKFFTGSTGQSFVWDTLSNSSTKQIIASFFVPNYSLGLFENFNNGPREPIKNVSDIFLLPHGICKQFYFSGTSRLRITFEKVFTFKELFILIQLQTKLGDSQRRPFGSPLPLKGAEKFLK